MKFVINPFLRAILIVAVWLLCIRQIYIDFDHSRFLNIIFPAFVLLASIVSLLSFLVDYVRYKTDKKLISFTPTTISMLSITAVIVISHHLKQQDKTPTVFCASKFYSGLNTLSIDFRENGTYKCEKSIFMSDSYFTRGRYSMRDSVIYLDKSNLFDLVKTDKLQMRTIPKNVKAKKGNLLTLLFGSSKPDTLPETFLFQLDNKGDTISSAIVLRMNND
jgi:hypothetical protein